MGVLLTIQEVAQELGVPTLNVQRLVALGQLEAATLGNGLRFTAQQLEQYVAAGARQLTMPAVHNNDWFDDSDTRWSANQFRQSVREALKAGAPAQVPETLFSNGNRQVLIECQAGSSASLQILLASPAQFSRPNGTAAPLKLSALYGLHQLREAARAKLQFSCGGKSPIEQLYASPAQFHRIVAQAKSDVLSGTITQPVPFQLTSGCPVQIHYRLNHTRFLNRSRLEQLAKLAF